MQAADPRPGRGRRLRRKLFGVRPLLAVAFAAIALVTAGLAYLLVNETTGQGAADEQLLDLTAGRTFRLAGEVAERPADESQNALEVVSDSGYSAWIFDDEGRLRSPPTSQGVAIEDVPFREEAIDAALAGNRYSKPLGSGVSLVAAPVTRNGEIDEIVIARASRAPELQEAIDAVRSDRLTALVIALAVAVIVGFLVASAITNRIKRLAESAQRLALGELDEPVGGIGGGDEITDLGRSLDSMRTALRETFSALRSERDRLSAIFESLGEAVLVVGSDGLVRFSNTAAQALVTSEGTPIGQLLPWLRRARHRGSAVSDALSVGDRVYAITAREVPAENAVLAVVRDRTEELRRQVAERDFVSNAAHELRNPIAGISSAVEVLQSGAKDDPAARDRFLQRLAENAERISRLTESLLILARMESVGEGATESVDIRLAMDDALAAVPSPPGVTIVFELATEPVAEGDSVLLRQVLIGLLTNAIKHTPAPGTVTVRARREGDEVRVEVADTGDGIPPEDIGRIFERFYRGPGALQREGFGLGLSIAQRMVDVMGGRIGVESRLGEGSTFWVRLPAANRTDPGPGVSSGAVSSA
ncbi:HAMP domain-containing protein [Thermoleophilia bacterium SCSIO 60948]|nr:HAMP domain-containing protein [Thermoleophilia bacterium SCSIO 60948]